MLPRRLETLRIDVGKSPSHQLSQSEIVVTIAVIIRRSPKFMSIDFPVAYLVLLVAIASIVFGSVLLLHTRKAGGSPQRKRSLQALVALGSLALIYSVWNIATAGHVRRPREVVTPV
jgi:hypothetical protein